MLIKRQTDGHSSQSGTCEAIPGCSSEVTGMLRGIFNFQGKHGDMCQTLNELPAQGSCLFQRWILLHSLWWRYFFAKLGFWQFLWSKETPTKSVWKGQWGWWGPGWVQGWMCAVPSRHTHSICTYLWIFKNITKLLFFFSYRCIIFFNGLLSC